jgi:glycosyltransferase involved in cell wall biosynthesis
MRVLSVIHYPIYGGPHNRNASVIPLLRERGFETTVVLPDDPGNAAELLRGRNVEVVQLPLSRLRAVRDPLTHLRFLARFRADVARLRGLIRAREIDLVLVNGLANPHAAIAGHLERIPVVWQLLDSSPMPLRRAMMPLLTRIADVIMSTGLAIAEGHPGATEFGDRLVLFFPVADTRHFVNSDAVRRAARERLGLPADGLVVGTIGNINLMKGHDIFIEAAAKVREQRPGTRFVILGAQATHHAAYTDELWRRAAELGLRLGEDLLVVDPGTDIIGFAPAFDVFWLTSNPSSEGIPTAIGEAMALELPVVATRVGSVHEAVAEGVTGTLVSPRDPAQLAQATLPYLDDRELRRRAGQAGRARAELLYSPTVCVDRHQRAFELAARHRAERTSPRVFSNAAPNAA